MNGILAKSSAAVDHVLTKPIRFVQVLGEMLTLLGRATLWGIRPPYRWHLLLQAMEFIGVGSLSIIVLVSMFTGGVFGLQSVEAFRIFREHVGEIDLALIDVMHPPGAGAADLLPKLLIERPDLDVILTSGDALPMDLEEKLKSIGGRFLRKPFVPKTLNRLLEVAGRDATGATSHPARPEVV